MVSQSGLITHLIELRSRLLKMLVSVLLIFVCLSPFAQTIYHLLAQPLLNPLPEGASMIAYRNEKKLIAPLLFSSSLLFYAGMAFAYFVLFPVAFGFLTSFAPEGVVVSTDISSYLSFVLTIFFAFGVAFEIPIAIILLCWTGVTTAQQLRQKRPYIVVAAFVVGMLLTPPDVISQVLLAIPMWFLYEVGIIIGSIYSKRNSSTERTTQSE
jgi:sec-independent protein translocase protein TatC